ncbi:unnamed protein product [Gordionus sp. m RMFG-2023]
MLSLIVMCVGSPFKGAFGVCCKGKKKNAKVPPPLPKNPKTVVKNGDFSEISNETTKIIPKPTPKVIANKPLESAPDLETLTAALRNAKDPIPSKKSPLTDDKKITKSNDQIIKNAPVQRYSPTKTNTISDYEYTYEYEAIPGKPKPTPSIYLLY